ncbi:MAG: LytR C-terminal domain-containing protein [Frankiaceae bacterium]|nr:LytR C-terminal domain-containing protein [Frankiaceae bacterium]
MTGKRRANRPTNPSPSPSAAPVGGRPPTRRELRAERRRVRRRKLGAGGIAGVVVLVLALLAGGGFFVHNATSGPAKPTDPQQTMLVALVGGDRSAAASMLAAHQAAPRAGFEMLVPSRLLTDVCGYGSQQFGRVFTLPDGAKQAATTLSQVLGDVRIDGTLTLTQTQLSRLVDGVGGVVVDVDTDVITTSGGSRVVTIPKGPAQRLNGANAVLFSTYVASGEPPAASLPRFQSVLEALILALPRKSAGVTSALRTAQVDGPTATEAASLFTALAADDRSKQLLSEIMPTQPIDSGGGTPSYRVDPTALKNLVASQLAKSLPADDVSKRPTVLIQNGVGTPGLVLSACNRLLPAGFNFAGSGNAPSFGHSTTQIFVFPPTPDDLVRVTKDGDRVADLLHVPRSDVLASTQGNNVADVVVVLGGDYKP